MTEQHQITDSCFSPENPYHILVVDKLRRIAEGLRTELGENVRIDHVVTADTAIQLMGLMSFNLIILQLKLPLFSGLELARQLKKIMPSQVILPICPPQMTTEAEELMRMGYPPPLNSARDITLELAEVCREHMLAEVWFSRIDSLKKELKDCYNYDRMLSLTPEIRAVYDRLSMATNAMVPILITGESGTGKELAARMIHDTVVNQKKPFVIVNCAAIPEGLLESQFFGHEKGAFTGAVSRMTGKFEQADNGTLFLDEIGEMSLPLQAKFLRVIEYGEFERVGGSETIRVKVRLITATHHDLEQEVENGNFRADLMYRINVFPIHLPPLRERNDDVILLAHHFLKRASQRNNRHVISIHPEAMDILRSYPWHGNIRELENAVERAVLLSDGTRLKPDDFPRQLEECRRQPSDASAVSPPAEEERIGTEREIRPLRIVEREAISSALALTDGNIALTARQLGISRNTLYRKIEEHGLNVPKSDSET